MPATTCLLCHGPIHLTQAELQSHQVPTIGLDCRRWLTRGLGLDGLQGIAFSLEQLLLISCLEAAVEAGHVGEEARNEADRMIAAAIDQIQEHYSQKTNLLPAEAPIDNAPLPRAERPSLLHST